MSSAPVAELGERRRGRPRKVDADGTDTPERLLRAAVEACVEHGFEGVTMADVARRAGVRAPTIYGHFDGKAELLVAAARRAVDEQVTTRASDSTPAEIVRHFLSDELADTRRLVVELQLASHRHPAVAELLASWHREVAASIAARVRGADPEAVVKTFYVLLLGSCHVDDYGGIPATAGDVADQLCRLLPVLFGEQPDGADPR